MDSQFGSDLNFQKFDNCIREDTILVGYPEGLGSGKADLDLIAKWQSTGAGNIKTERPFLEDGILSEEEKIKELIKKIFEDMIRGNSPNYDRIAIEAIAAIQKFVRSDYYETNKPIKDATIRRKTSKKGRASGDMKSKPLIDTGLLINSITYLIEGK